MCADNLTPGGIVPARTEVLQNVTQIVADQLGRPVDGIAECSALDEDLGCDSLDIVEIAMRLEEHFDIAIPDDFGERARTIGAVTDGVLQLLAASASH
jgi:acyl carrier protein